SFESAEQKRFKLRQELYAQYFHLFASQVEALCLDLLSRNGYTGEDYSRSIFYGFNKDKNIEVTDLSRHDSFARLYLIWNFLKHNSQSAFKKLRAEFSDVLPASEFKNGDLACYFVNFTDDLVPELVVGIEVFLVAYCREILGESHEDA